MATAGGVSTCCAAELPRGGGNRELSGQPLLPRLSGGTWGKVPRRQGAGAQPPGGPSSIARTSSIVLSQSVPARLPLTTWPSLAGTWSRRFPLTSAPTGSSLTCTASATSSPPMSEFPCFPCPKSGRAGR